MASRAQPPIAVDALGVRASPIAVDDLGVLRFVGLAHLGILHVGRGHGGRGGELGLGGNDAFSKSTVGGTEDVAESWGWEDPHDGTGAGKMTDDGGRNDRTQKRTAFSEAEKNSPSR